VTHIKMVAICGAKPVVTRFFNVNNMTNN